MRHRKTTANGAYIVNRSAAPRKSTDAHGNHSFTTREQIIHHAEAHPISAVFRLRYLHDVMRRWVASWGKAVTLQRRQSAAENGNWGDGDSTAKNDRPDGTWHRCRGNVPSPCQLRLVQQVRQPRRPQIWR